MRFTIQREELFKPLQQTVGAVERRQTMAILGNVLLRSEAGKLWLTTTDLEIELVSSCAPESIDADSSLTVPARKLFDICRSLPEAAEIELIAESERALVRSGRSRFTLTTLPAQDYPALDTFVSQAEFTLPKAQLKGLLSHTAFAMAQQDVRYYLNGLLLEVTAEHVTTVATDGHRLAIARLAAALGSGEYSVIVPRKAVTELSRLISDEEGEVTVRLGANNIELTFDGLRFTSKLIDGRFPDYQRVIPSGNDKAVVIEREVLRQALQRASILSNEKYRGVRLGLAPNLMRIEAHNPEQEEAEVELEIDYSGEEMDIGFNLTYLLDVINTVSGENLQLEFRDSSSSVLISDPSEPGASYVIMPMRL
jgi:DNA polymerase III subunit beta